MGEISQLGVKAIRDGVAGGEFTAREAAEAFNANVAAASTLNAFIVATPEKALEAADAVDAARGKQADIERERERLSWQIGELEKLSPGPDEWPELDAEHTRLGHAQALIEAAQGALDAIADADLNAGSLTGGGVRDAVLANAPAAEHGFYGVPKVIE